MADTKSLPSHLWDAANILRGSAVDRTDWKGYILPLPFFKRICDVWNEEVADATETYGDVDPAAFPDSVTLDNSALPLVYAYRPGQETDGVTLKLSARQARNLQPSLLDWLVPGHLEEKVNCLLRGLPKELRRGIRRARAGGASEGEIMRAAEFFRTARLSSGLNIVR